MSQWKKIALLIVLLIIADQVFAQGCSQCKMLAEQASGHGGGEVTESTFGNNLNYGILYLMAIPYVLLVFFFRKRIVRLFKALTNRKTA
jgi:hypothetical protein